MKFFETVCVALVALASLSIAAPTPNANGYAHIEATVDEPGPGYGL